MTQCPECDATLTKKDGMIEGEIFACPDCGTELEVTGTDPFMVAHAPKEEEDWGE